MDTYGQLANGKKLTYQEYEKEVADKLKKYVALQWQNKKSAALCKKLYKKGYSISDTVSFIILNS